MDAVKLQSQLEQHRKTVSFDSYDITVRQLLDMVAEGSIDIAPEYQRHFIWGTDRQSALIESLLLGIPVPSLFMATNSDATWEVIDGLQRLTTMVNFIGDDKTIQRVNPECSRLRLESLEKLDEMNGLTFGELPKSVQLHLQTRPVRITVLNDKTDKVVRFDLFERLNTGGVVLHQQEIRNCVYIGKFNDMIKELAANPDFRAVVKTTERSERTGNFEELVLKFFAYFQDREKFTHSVKDFLNEYMDRKTKRFDDENHLKRLFEQTFRVLAEFLPQGIVRGSRVNVTPLVLYEAISIGVADLIEGNTGIDGTKLREILNDAELKRLTTGATNTKNRLVSRIAFVRDRTRL